jgi:hypothetical protein
MMQIKKNRKYRLFIAKDMPIAVSARHRWGNGVPAVAARWQPAA